MLTRKISNDGKIKYKLPNLLSSNDLIGDRKSGLHHQYLKTT